MTKYADAAATLSWDGVFAERPDEEALAVHGGRYLVVTAVHCVDNQFYELGAVTHEVGPSDLVKHFQQADKTPGEADIIWMLDLHGADGGIESDCEITAETAAVLLDLADVDALMARVAVGQVNYRAWSDHPVHG